MPEPHQEPAYRLIDGRLLRRLMRCPEGDGKRHTVRSLAAATGISKSKISSMLNDQQTRLPQSKADAVAHEVAVRRKALFTPIVSTITNKNILREGDT